MEEISSSNMADSVIDSQDQPVQSERKQRIIRIISIKKKTPSPKKDYPLEPICKFEVERLILKSMIGGGGNNFNEMLGTSLRNILDSENFNSDDKGQVEGKDSHHSKTRLVCTFAAKEIFDNHVKLHRLVNGNYLDRPSPYKAHIRMAKEEGADNKDRLDEKYKETGKLLLPTFLLKK